MKSKTFFKNTKKTVVIIAGLLLLLAFAQCKKDDPANPNGDGKVEIPKGMSNTDIIITNFNEEAVPDENGDFAVGYSKMLMAKNASNGELIYFTMISTDRNTKKEVGDGSEYELNAKETAIFLTLRCIPFSLRSGSDESFVALKNTLYSLQCVKDLEDAIRDVVNTYGYLKGDELTGPVGAVKSFLRRELFTNGKSPYDGYEQSDFDGEKQIELQSPYLPTDRAFGTRFFIDEKTHTSTVPELWTIKCTGYNGLPAAFGVVKGEVNGMEKQVDGEGDRGVYIDFQYDENSPMYYIPPTGLTNFLDVATLSDWEGLKMGIREMAYMINHNTTIPMDFYKSKTENMIFELPEPTLGGSNALCVIAPMDNTNVYIVNSVFAIMDLLDFAIPSYKCDELIQDFLNDQEYVTMFLAQMHNGSEGIVVIMNQTMIKLLSLITQDLIQNGMINQLPELLQTLTGLDMIANSFDIVAEISSALYLRSFALSVIAEYNNPPTTLPSVTTDTCTVDGTTVTISGSLNSIGSYSIAELGVCYSTSQNPSPWSDVCVPAEGTEVGTFRCVIENLPPNTYYARAYAKTWVEPLAGYGDVVSFTIVNGGDPHDYVDLGLPSGTLWATCNVGANSPEEYGDYFSWGETQPKDYYDISTYLHCMGSYNTLTKYCNDPSCGYNGFTDNLTTLLSEDDAATANRGDDWRMPTIDEWQELCNNTTSTWMTQNGVNGMLFTASNGNRLFLPAAGDQWSSGLINLGYGDYWSSSLDIDNPIDARCLGFCSTFGFYMYNWDRGCGHTVRPVRSARQN